MPALPTVTPRFFHPFSPCLKIVLRHFQRLSQAWQDETATQTVEKQSKIIKRLQHFSELSVHAAVQAESACEHQALRGSLQRSWVCSQGGAGRSSARGFGEMSAGRYYLQRFPYQSKNDRVKRSRAGSDK